MSSFSAPRGMRDFYPEDMALRNAIFDAWRAAAGTFGFAPYDACVVESLELLKRKAGEEIVDQIYTFTDKSGRDLALRPEMTPTLARMITARQGALTFPVKWYAIAQCFRYERMSRGRKREHYQWNLDIVGEPGIAAEAEVIACAVQAMRLMGLTPADFAVHFSSRALLADVLRSLGIDAAAHAAVFLALDKRGKIDDAEIRTTLSGAGLDEAAVGRIFGVLETHSLAEIEAILPSRPKSLADLQEFSRLAEVYGMADALTFDIGVVRGLSYYTGMVFEAFDRERKFRAIFGGGRYDNLMADVGGRSATAVGLGFGDVVVAELLAEKGKLPRADGGADIGIGFMAPEQREAATTLATDLRRQGRRVDLALASEKARVFFARVGNAGFREAAYLGPDDVAGGTVRIKDLASRTERTLPLQAPRTT